MPRRVTIPRRYRLHAELAFVTVVIGVGLSVALPRLRERAEDERQRQFREGSLLIYQGDLDGLRSFVREYKASAVADTRGNGHTLLHVASGQRNPKMMLVLFDAGLNADASEDDGKTPLFSVFETHDPQYNPMGAADATALLLEHGADPNAVDRVGRTPLLVAVQNGERDAAQLLIGAGADVNKRREASPATPLLAAVADGRIELAQILLEAGADPNIPDWNGESCLHLAVRADDVEMLTLLLEHKANPAISSTVHAQTPLDLAREIGCGACSIHLAGGQLSRRRTFINSRIRPSVR